jgi:hypothetical protein
MASTQEVNDVLVEVAKIALLVFLAGAVLTILVTYYRRRRAGVRPWRPANSRILGYDAPIPEIANQASQGKLGYPTADEMTESDGSFKSTFEHGTITFKPGDPDATITTN